MGFILKMKIQFYFKRENNLLSNVILLSTGSVKYDKGTIRFNDKIEDIDEESTVHCLN